VRACWSLDRRSTSYREAIVLDLERLETLLAVALDHLGDDPLHTIVRLKTAGLDHISGRAILDGVARPRPDIPLDRPQRVPGTTK
jgi:hypothetical protein